MAAQMAVALASKVQAATWQTAAVVSLAVVAVAAAVILFPPVPFAASVVVVSIAVASLAIVVVSVVVAAAAFAVVAVAAPSASSVEFAATGRAGALEAEEILLMVTDLAAAGY